MIRLLRQGLFVVVLLAPPVAGAEGELRELLLQDFRNSQYRDDLFDQMGRDPAKHIIPEAGGLRITLPVETEPCPPTGLIPRIPIIGDFEITLSYEILALDPPKGGYGSGVMILVAHGGGEHGLAAISRSHRTKEGSVYVVNRAVPEQEGKLRHRKQCFPTTTSTGKLRLKRTQATIYYLAAEGTSEEFRELSSAPFAADNPVSVRIVADPGGARSQLDVLFKDLHIRTGDTWTTEEKQNRAVTDWLFWFISGALVGVAVVVAALLVIRRTGRWRTAVASRATPPKAKTQDGAKTKQQQS